MFLGNLFNNIISHVISSERDIIEEENAQKDIGLYNKKTREKIPLYYIDISVDINLRK